MRFKGGSFAAALTVVSGLGLPVTGVANHLLQGEPLHGPRHVRMGAHNALGLVFLAACFWLVALNRRALAGHFRPTGRVVPRPEFAAAVLLVAFVVFVGAGHAVPIG